jgi:hypothetical protein
MTMKHCFRSLVATLLFSAVTSASAQIAVIVGPGATPPSKAQLEELYLGKNFDYKPLDLAEGSPLREQFYKKLTKRDLSQVKAVWARIVFTGKGLTPAAHADAAAVKRAVIADPKAVGYIDKASVDGSVKVVLTLD